MPEGHCHPNTWTATGVTRVAFNHLGASSSHHTMETRRVLDCQALVSQAGSSAVDAWWHQINDYLKTQASSADDCGVIQRGLDCTPLEATFGAMRDLLAPVARYFWRDRQPKSGNGTVWRKLTYEELRKLGLARNTKSGVLELCAQMFAVDFDTHIKVDGTNHTITIAENLPVPPCFLQNGRGSTLYAAMDSSSFGSWEAMRAFASRFKVLIVVLTMDTASTNIRLAAEWSRRAVEHNRRVLVQNDPRGMILLVIPLCFGHVLHNSVEDTYRQDDLIPQLHAFEYVHRNRINYSAAFRSLAELVEQELDFIPDVSPPAAYLDHANQIIKATLLRPLRCRGRMDGASRSEERLLIVAENLRKGPNGAWWLRRLTHFCPSLACCAATDTVSRRQVAVQKTTSSIADAFYEELGQQVSMNKWWSMSPCLGRQAGGISCCGVLPRNHERAFGEQCDEEEAAMPEGDRDVGGCADDAVDWKVYNHRKLQKSLAAMRGVGSLYLSALLVTEAPDRLTKRIEHLDEQKRGQTLMEVSHPEGLLTQAQAHLFAFVTTTESDVCPVPITVLLNQFPDTSPTQLLEPVVAASLNISGRIWAQGELVFFNRPYSLSRLLDPKVAEREKICMRQEFVEANDCDDDVLFGQPVKRIITGPDDLRRPWFLNLLKKFVRTAKVMNMSLEHLLARYSAAVRYSRHKPTAERAVYSGHLAELFYQHGLRGGKDIRQPKRADVLRKGVPVRSNRTAKAKLRRGAKRIWGAKRPHLSWFNRTHNRMNKKRWELEQPRSDHPWLDLGEALQRQKAEELDAHSDPEPMGPMDEKILPLAQALRCDVGDERWPVSPATTAAFAAEWDARPRDDSHVGSRQPGPVNTDVIGKLRLRNRPAICRFDRNDIPPNRVFRIQKPCWALHPGLCSTDHEAIYKPALQLAKQLEQVTPKSRRSSFCRSYSADGNIDWMLYLAHVRARRPHAQVTRVFAHLNTEYTSPGDEWKVVRFKRRDGPTMAVFDFAAPWHLSVEALQQTVADLSIVFLQCHYEGDCAWRVWAEEQPLQFWPNSPKRPAPAKQLDVGDARRPKRRRKDVRRAPEVCEVSLPPRATDAAHVRPVRVSNVPEEKPPNLVPSDTSDSEASEKEYSPESPAPEDHGDVFEEEYIPESPALRSPSMQYSPESPAPDDRPEAPAPEDSPEAPAPEDHADVRGPLYCLADGRSYRRHRTGLIYDLGADSPCGKLTGPVGWGSVQGPEQMFWSMKCKWPHSTSSKPCTCVKTNRQLRNDETRLIAWLLDGRNLSRDGHFELWSSTYEFDS